MEKPLVGTLYLVPVPIAPGTYSKVIPLYNTSILQQIDYFLAEDAKTARRFIKEVAHPTSLTQIQILDLNKQQSLQHIEASLQPLRMGKSMGILSESGCPGIADPGTAFVQWAHQHSISVIPLVGPCSILLALMASGLNGQNFTFHGYLPIDQQKRKKTIRQLEFTALKHRQTQIFIETPYRNDVMLEALLEVCKPTTWLCIGKEITAPQGWVRTHLIHDWKINKPYLHQVPTIFLLAGSGLR